MAPSAGQSLRTFILRIFGTFLAMVAAFIAYYIVDGNTAGVLVFFFIFLHAGVYVVVKYPAVLPIGTQIDGQNPPDCLRDLANPFTFLSVGMIGQVTLTLILGEWHYLPTASRT